MVQSYPGYSNKPLWKISRGFSRKSFLPSPIGRPIKNSSVRLKGPFFTKVDANRKTILLTNESKIIQAHLRIGFASFVFITVRRVGTIFVPTGYECGLVWKSGRTEGGALKRTLLKRTCWRDRISQQTERAIPFTPSAHEIRDNSAIRAAAASLPGAKGGSNPTEKSLY
jgi:hypothetical protein